MREFGWPGSIAALTAPKQEKSDGHLKFRNSASQRLALASFENIKQHRISCVEFEFF